MGDKVSEAARGGPDARAAVVAARQWGVVSAAQLIRCGMSRNMIAARLARGSLRRLHRGVYAWGHDHLRAEGRLLAAVLACGPAAVLSHRAAAAHWGLLASARAVTDVTVVASGGRPRRSITLSPVPVAGPNGCFAR